MRTKDLSPGSPTLSVLPVTPESAACRSWLCAPSLDPGGSSSRSFDPVFLPQSQEQANEKTPPPRSLWLALSVRFNTLAAPQGTRTQRGQAGAGGLGRAARHSAGSRLPPRLSPEPMPSCPVGLGRHWFQAPGAGAVPETADKAPTWASYRRAFLPGDSSPHRAPLQLGALRGVLGFPNSQEGRASQQGASGGPQAFCRTPFIKRPFEPGPEGRSGVRGRQGSSRKVAIALSLGYVGVLGRRPGVGLLENTAGTLWGQRVPLGEETMALCGTPSPHGIPLAQRPHTS